MEVVNYGIARLGLISVRRTPDYRSEQLTQLLFGEHYEVIKYSADNNWAYIRIYADQYEGWIDSKQHYPISLEYFNQASHVDYKITTDLTSTLLYKKKILTILIGSIIPISDSELFNMEEQFAFNGEAKSGGQKGEFDFLQNIALRYLNAPYTWGGRSPFGIDCSGFIQVVFKICGYKLPRDAYQQAKVGEAVKCIADAQPGDLAFFAEDKGNISHVGLMLDDKKIIHASGMVRIDQLTQEGIFNVDTKAYTHTLAHIKRILPPPQ